jgi:orotidine-5'-phosphate decarboxylase
MTFGEKLGLSEDRTGSLLCLGLDPDPELLPPTFPKTARGVAEFVSVVVDAVTGIVSSFKLNLAFYERWGRDSDWVLDRALSSLPSGAPVILDGKRGDIGNTAQAYAHAIFDEWGADATTVMPYLGFDSVAPFLAHHDRGVLVVCRTSNPSAAEFQHLQVDGEALYRHVARHAIEWDRHGNLGLVAGATAPTELREIRQIAGTRLLLVPGIGVQGADLDAAVSAALNSEGRGAIISVSRGILAASMGTDFAEAAHAAAVRYRDAINALRPEPAAASS